MYKRRDLLDDGLFHGTIEKIEGDLRVGDPDGVFWTALTPNIAQTYMPASGMSATISIPAHGATEKAVVPQGIMGDILAGMGYIPTYIEKEPSGLVRAWSFGARPLARMSQVREYLAGLGYDVGRDSVKVKMGFAPGAGKGGQVVVRPADYKEPGRLYIALPTETLRLADMAAGHEGCLVDPDHRKIDAFREMEFMGYDGVVINDFAQSPSAGNVGHESIGLFPKGLTKITAISVPASHVDGAGRGYPWPDETDDFVEGHRSLVAAAVAEGLPVPKDIAAEARVGGSPAAPHRGARR
ncbi:MAG: hypothetical protein U0974_15830 [Gemmatimonadales bacterium]|nr:hypothetical protein [Gemmatimonadales bacterium]